MVTSLCTWVHVVGDLSHDWPLGAFFCKFNSFAQGSTPTPLSVGKPSNATSLYVCLSASISPIKTTRPKFAEFPVHVTRCRESVLLAAVRCVIGLHFRFCLLPATVPTRFRPMSHRLCMTSCSRAMARSSVLFSSRPRSDG